MRKTFSKIGMIGILGLSASAYAAPVKCDKNNPMFSEAIAKKLIKQWNDSLVSGAAAANVKDGAKSVVATNYAPHAVLLPTVSSVIRVDNGQINEYFEHFLLKSPHLASGSPYNTVVYSSCGVGVSNGDYDFNFKGESAPAQARYTFVYEYISKPEGKQKPGWYIVTHHSSVQPPAKKIPDGFEY